MRSPLRKRLASNAVAIAGSQVITAGGSLLMQVIAARELGLSGYGAYALCIAMLTTTVALYTGYVGDALTVMDRHEPRTRGALALSAVIGLALAFGIAFAMVVALGLGTWRAGFVFAVMVSLWLVEETGRRVLIARLEMWRLVANDGTYMAITLLALGGALLLGAHVSLTLLLASTAVGCAAAVALAVFQLPPAERDALRPRTAGSREIASFATWRSLQSTLRPTQLLVARVLVLDIVSLAAVGFVEAGRLVVAPVQTLLNGASAFLLSTGADSARREDEDFTRNTRVAVLLVGATGVCGALAAVLSHPLGRLLAGRAVPPWLVLGWAAYLAMWAASLPFTAELVVRKLSRPAFVARLVESVVGVGMISAVLGLGGSPQSVPWLLAAPALANTWALRRMAVKSRPGVSNSAAASSAESVIFVKSGGGARTGLIDSGGS